MFERHENKAHTHKHILFLVCVYAFSPFCLKLLILIQLGQYTTNCIRFETVFDAKIKT